MTTPFHAALTDFTPVQLAKPIPQRFALELSAYGFARAHCLSHGITDKAGFEQIHREVKGKFERYALSSSQINRRQLIFFPALKDIRFINGQLDVAEPVEPHLRVHDYTKDPRGADLRSRHESYGKVAGQAVTEMYQTVEQAPDDMIHVTCSGYLAPSPIERLAASRRWFNTTVTHSYHMGCYGAFPAIKMAHGYLSSSQFAITPPRQRVDIVHTELLSAHNNITDLRAENIITMSLFADGLIKYSLCPEQTLRSQGRSGLKILAANEHLLPDSEDEMTWIPGPHHFAMTLTPMVPVVIKRHVEPFVRGLLAQAGIDFDREKSKLACAIHPGGPRIVEHIQEVLGLRDDQVAISLGVFRGNGNMSSATVPHIFKEMLEMLDPGTRILSLAFGPGLTVTGLVLEKI